ncbi:transmembrane protein 164 [Diaphorina citri]|uniref:Transmembrane protein 164 n=1 Tax=Diaphorina citri TaxID=121845 RepID=A0A3Q0IZV2_DIACI|nr:transmembrane protein 164 [Diaphorina citri]XP_026680217.1 transmembrane protein 164 [Diaphorina citri]XP_026680218.1 transmembrane protein 164 [Diaphorina citri]
MWSTVSNWLWGGVDVSLMGNGGVECARYLSLERKLLEGLGVSVFVFLMMRWSYAKLAPLPREGSAAYRLKHEPLKQILLVTMCVVFGMEIGFKFASRSVIFLLNPCHVVTAIQIYLLAAKPSKHVAAIFRAHLNVINGPILACIFPEVDTLVLPLETSIFWMQHSLMIVIPICMIHMGGVYSVEPPSHMSWFTFSYGIVLLYHFILLQAISMAFQINLNHMLCPADADPFSGPYYRLAACVHQAIFTPIVSRAFCIFNVLVRKFQRDEHHGQGDEGSPCMPYDKVSEKQL